MNIISKLRRKRKEAIPEGYRKCDRCKKVFLKDELFQILEFKSKTGPWVCEDCLNAISGGGRPIDE